MTIKEYMQQYKNLNNKINLKQEKLERLKALSTKVTPVYSSMPKGCSSEDKIQCAVEKIILLQEEINNDIDKLTRIKENIIMSARSTNNDVMCKLLIYRYIDLMSWEQIAKKLKINVCGNKTTYIRTKLHMKSLNKITIYCI